MEDNQLNLPARPQLQRWHKLALAVLGILVASMLILGTMRLAYRGRFLPGVKIYGVNVGGQTRDGAIEILKRSTSDYIDSSTIIINSSQANVPKVTIPASEVELSYDIEQDVNNAYSLGRTGQVFEQLGEQLSLLTGAADTTRGTISFNPTKLYIIMQPIDAAFASPVENATYATNNGILTVIPEKTGKRANWSRFLSDYKSLTLQLKRGDVTITTEDQPAIVTSTILETKRTTLTPFLQNPLAVTFETKRWEIPPSTLVSWLSSGTYAVPAYSNLITNYYAIHQRSPTTIGFDTTRIKDYLQTISTEVNRPAKDATLAVSGDRATVFQQSQDGRAIDLDMTAKTIADNLQAERPQTSIPLTVVVTKADVTDDNIDRLGIKELLAEGVTYFPGSSANRIVNVRTGAKRFNGVLLKPGQVFSFGEILGPVGPEQGYLEGRVILEGRQESQYGGGLCQVSSTAFRAALLAGLPILERYNHSFAVSYYTAPYGVPGVDATIYYPQVDFKFKNDTAHHILIQTEMIGTTLKFRYYGTKEKEGVIRGPNFIYGSNDPNQPSKTVFYRDIKVNGVVTKTDTFYTTYRSALDFPSAN